MRFHDPFQSTGNVVERLIPGDAAPLALPSFPGTDERVPRALVVVDQGDSGAPARAERFLDPRRVRISLDERAHAIFRLHFNGTTDTAHPANTEHLFLRHFQLRGGNGFHWPRLKLPSREASGRGAPAASPSPLPARINRNHYI